MADSETIAADVGMAEMLAIVAVIGVGGYLIYKYWKGATCISKVGAIPGITGASQSQVCAANKAASKLKPGGATVWSCGSDYDYLQPCGAIVTEARHNFLNYVWPWSEPVTYTDVPIACYCKPACLQRAQATVNGAQSC